MPQPSDLSASPLCLVTGAGEYPADLERDLDALSKRTLPVEPEAYDDFEAPLDWLDLSEKEEYFFSDDLGVLRVPDLEVCFLLLET